MGKKQPDLFASLSEENFKTAWAIFSSLRSGMSRADAAKAWVARVKEGCNEALMLEGARKYAEYCKTNRTQPQHIKHAATFFGPSKHFLNDYSTNTELVLDDKRADLMQYYQRERLV